MPIIIKHADTQIGKFSSRMLRSLDAYTFDKYPDFMQTDTGASILHYVSAWNNALYTYSNVSSYDCDVLRHPILVMNVLHGVLARCKTHLLPKYESDLLHMVKDAIREVVE